MATSVSRRSPSAVHPTREQLDDLDALLKRMLDLPVNRLEDESDEDEAPSQAEEEAPVRFGAAARAASRGFRSSAGKYSRSFGAFQYNTPHAEEADLKPRVIIVAPNAPENERTPPRKPRLFRRRDAMEKPIGGQPEDWVPLTSSWRPSSRTWKPLTEAWEQAQGETRRQRNRETRRQGDKETRRQGDKETKTREANPHRFPSRGLPTNPKWSV